VDALGDAGDELPGSNAAAVGGRHGQAFGLQRGDGCRQRFPTMGDGFFDAFAIGDALGKVGIGNQVTTAFAGR
jgi:hypothetical protein